MILIIIFMLLITIPFLVKHCAYFYISPSICFYPQSLESAQNQRKPSVLAIQKKGEELMEQIRVQGNLPVSFEHNLKTFNDRWETVSNMIDEKKHKASLARQRRDVVDMNTKVETILKDAERFIDIMGLMPDNEYEIKAQQDQCKVTLNVRA